MGRSAIGGEAQAAARGEFMREGLSRKVGTLMNYRIKRGDQEFGPYSLAELKQYLAEGRVVPTDMALSEGMEDWIPVSQVVGDIELPQRVAPASSGEMIAPGDDDSNALPNVSRPPGLHWALLLLLAVVTASIFSAAWVFVQAYWVRKLDRRNISIWLFVGYVASALFAGGIQGAAEALEFGAAETVGTLIRIGGIICFFLGYFKIKESLEDRFGGPPLHLRMHGVLTLLLNVFYVQYHFTRINKLYEGEY